MLLRSNASLAAMNGLPASVDALPSCPNCKADGDDLTEVSSVSLIDEFSNLAAKGRSEVKFISTDTEEGAQLDSGFGGLAAVLRYPIM